MTDPKQDEKTEALQEVYLSDNPKKTSAIYNDWFENYEQHMTCAGYTHPAMVASIFSRYQHLAAGPVLDAGYGTGVMGVILPALGFTEVHGFDAPEGMLKFAAAKKIYANLRPGRLGETLPYADNQFDSCVSSGVFTQGHAPLDGLDELIRATKLGGHIAFSISRTYLGEMFENKAQAPERAGKWHRVDSSGYYDSASLSDDVLTAQVFAFAVT